MVRRDRRGYVSPAALSQGSEGQVLMTLEEAEELLDLAKSKRIPPSQLEFAVRDAAVALQAVGVFEYVRARLRSEQILSGLESKAGQVDFIPASEVVELRENQRTQDAGLGMFLLGSLIKRSQFAARPAGKRRRGFGCGWILLGGLLAVGGTVGSCSFMLSTTPEERRQMIQGVEDRKRLDGDDKKLMSLKEQELYDYGVTNTGKMRMIMKLDEAGMPLDRATVVELNFKDLDPLYIEGLIDVFKSGFEVNAAVVRNIEVANMINADYRALLKDFMAVGVYADWGFTTEQANSPAFKAAVFKISEAGDIIDGSGVRGLTVEIAECEVCVNSLVRMGVAGRKITYELLRNWSLENLQDVDLVERTARDLEVEKRKDELERNFPQLKGNSVLYDVVLEFEGAGFDIDEGFVEYLEALRGKKQDVRRIADVMIYARQKDVPLDYDELLERAPYDFHEGDLEPFVDAGVDIPKFLSALYYGWVRDRHRILSLHTSGQLSAHTAATLTHYLRSEEIEFDPLMVVGVRMLEESGVEITDSLLSNMGPEKLVDVGGEYESTYRGEGNYVNNFAHLARAGASINSGMVGAVTLEQGRDNFRMAKLRYMQKTGIDVVAHFDRIHAAMGENALGDTKELEELLRITGSRWSK